MKNLIYLLLILSFVACEKQVKNEQKFGIVSPMAATRNLIFEETFEGSTVFPVSGTSLNKIRGILDCNNNLVSPIINTVNPTPLPDYDWTLARATDAVYQGTKAIRFELRQDMPLVGSSEKHRCEASIIKGIEDSRATPEMWYSFAVYFPKVGTEADDVRDSWNQWFEDGSDETTLRMEQGKAFIEVTPPAGVTKLWKYDLFTPAIGTSGHTTQSTSGLAAFTNIERDTWHEFVFHFIHDQTDAGLIEVWRDGVKIHEIHGRNTHLTNTPKWTIGLYKPEMAKSARYSRVLYFDNVRLGNKTASLADMLSNSAPVDTIPTPINKAPVANAGTDITVTAPATVNLKGTATDSDGSIASVGWSGLLPLVNANTLTPSISFLTEGTYIFTLTVTDDKGATATDDVKVTVLAAPPPPPPASTTFTLVNASTDKDISALADNAAIKIAKNNYTVRANVAGATSVKFELSGSQTLTYTDKVLPFAMQGDSKGNYYYGTFKPIAGYSYTLKATPFAGSIALTSTTIHFTFTK